MVRDVLCLAFGTLTTWRVPPPRNIDARVAAGAMLIAPVVLVPLLVLMGLGVWVGSFLSVSPAVVAALLLAVLAVSSRGMHLDGLADTADGLSASYDRAKALDVMKRSDIGPSGVAAVVLSVLVQFSALVALVQSGAGVVLAVVAVVVSRASLAWGCRRGYPAASSSGLGATVAGSVSPVALAVVSVLVAAGSALVTHVCGGGWWHGLVVFGVGVAAVLLLLRHARARLGGMTGDVLGAGVEISLSVALVAGAVLVAAS
ncbi:adenosylcobinamide-GDP ribazoletransferase [Dermatophilus congolensis]|uniref:Adenosylcobinamide-GDP ribazoletransferase n=3 Tax=Dermatophilus congolensis TaxID=1863 RepID=A0A239VNV8_9MICO|nr:adenosylcobinamide-GDP ribazoletransferase [Dermatophilus congolensis]SNV23509.1 cobalamin synthase [Dermatophilus congolensis]